MLRAVIVAALTLTLAACSASPVRVRLTQTRPGDTTPTPLAGARVRAVMLDAGTIPLPLSAETIQEMLTRQETVAITDAQGVARLSLITSRSQLIEVEGPLDFSGATIPAARWLLTPDRTLEPVGDTGALRAELHR